MSNGDVADASKCGEDEETSGSADRRIVADSTAGLRGPVGCPLAKVRLQLQRSSHESCGGSGRINPIQKEAACGCKSTGLAKASDLISNFSWSSYHMMPNSRGSTLSRRSFEPYPSETFAVQKRVAARTKDQSLFLAQSYNKLIKRTFLSIRARSVTLHVSKASPRRHCRKVSFPCTATSA